MKQIKNGVDFLQAVFFYQDISCTAAFCFFARRKGILFLPLQSALLTASPKGEAENQKNFDAFLLGGLILSSSANLPRDFAFCTLHFAFFCSPQGRNFLERKLPKNFYAFSLGGIFLSALLNLPRDCALRIENPDGILFGEGAG